MLDLLHVNRIVFEQSIVIAASCTIALLACLKHWPVASIFACDSIQFDRVVFIRRNKWLISVRHSYFANGHVDLDLFTLSLINLLRSIVYNRKFNSSRSFSLSLSLSLSPALS